MKKSLFYIFMALVCAACTLAGCKKDDWRECSGLMKVLIQKKYQEP